jgi:sporulation protein YlmC with PRC-barrel domain
MFGRILMTTVAALALAAPVAAQDQVKPQGTEQEATQQQPPATAEEPGAGPAEGEVAPEEEAAPPPDMTFLQVQEEAQFLAADEVIGKDVVNVQDEEVGTIADLVMDQEQKLVGIVLSVGGFLGVGEKWVAIPVDEIEFPTRDQPARLLVAVTEEQLTNAPDFVTRDTVEAEEAATQAQQQQMQQQQQIPPPATGTQ